MVVRPFSFELKPWRMHLTVTRSILYCLAGLKKPTSRLARISTPCSFRRQNLDLARLMSFIRRWLVTETLLGWLKNHHRGEFPLEVIGEKLMAVLL
jgi:hypothetical protein